MVSRVLILFIVRFGFCFRCGMFFGFGYSEIWYLLVWIFCMCMLGLRVMVNIRLLIGGLLV